MSMGLNRWALNSSSMAFCTLAVASVQMRTSCWRRSPSVMMPRRNWVSTFSAWTSWSSRIVAFSFGVFTSSIDTVSPLCAAYR